MHTLVVPVIRCWYREDEVEMISGPWILRLMNKVKENSLSGGGVRTTTGGGATHFGAQEPQASVCVGGWADVKRRATSLGAKKLFRFV